MYIVERVIILSTPQLGGWSECTGFVTVCCSGYPWAGTSCDQRRFVFRIWRGILWCRPWMLGRCVGGNPGRRLCSQYWKLHHEVLKTRPKSFCVMVLFSPPLIRIACSADLCSSVGQCSGRRRSWTPRVLMKLRPCAPTWWGRHQNERSLGVEHSLPIVLVWILRLRLSGLVWCWTQMFWSIRYSSLSILVSPMSLTVCWPPCWQY